MKYQTNLIKNVNGNPIFIKINLDLDVVNATIDHFWKNQIGGTRLPSTNFLRHIKRWGKEPIFLYASILLFSFQVGTFAF